MMEKELLYLSIATVGIISVLGIILVYLVLRKAIENHFNSKIEIQKELYSDPLFSFILNPEISRKLIPDNPIKIKAIEQLLSKYVEILEGDSEKKNLYSIAELYLSKYYKTGLQSKSWSTRMNALHHIEDFNIHSLKHDVLTVISRKKATKEEIIIGLRILSFFHYENILDELLIRHSSLSDLEFRGILLKASDHTVEECLLRFHKSIPSFQKAVLDILAIKNELKHVNFIESVFRAYTGEIRLRALKTLATIGYVKDIHTYLPLCESVVWQERMIVARLLGATKEVEGLSCLKQLLHDQIWWVRSQAAQSIRNYPNGINILKDIFQTSKDPFAVDMAREWIYKGD
jgi:hypothetical protein